MAFSDIINKIKHELKVFTGDESKDKGYHNQRVYTDKNQADIAFEQSKKKLFDVNRWSEMKGINSTFVLHDEFGRKASGDIKKGYFIKIDLPGLKIENWVQVSDVRVEPELAEFVVHPSKKPEEKTDPNAEVKHFFTEEASSTFRVIKEGNTIKAFEIGQDEVINNEGDDSGNRALLNTLIAEGGWAGFQKIQWEKLTSYLVHLEEAEKNQ